ncbi:siphovirus ReqiPepy6 Gp37-like family protein [Mechercharimyces sp. CAU 1602]|uniref:siphovirus ReqiPepy6 Gp37-like family protein n=1 Tax=Mechercharimyces sp. CAU 1602 TaxID=2973933 RepID=UPI002163A9E8|nr:siphovirus ReqiPepy6 Gp37-like family protein [Mechercharimyces sp. CAU 1602]MCS1351141.1 siphovirus ReqiPepy6 Gp37-like family protein [Mechercharimyces sp. CAU 1602]
MEALKSHYRIRVRNKKFEFVGEVDEYISLQVELKYNEVSKWTLKLDATSDGAQLFYNLMDDPNNGGIGGVYIERNGYLLLSGPYLDAEEEASVAGEYLTLSGSCDMIWIQNHLALPHPKFMASPKMSSSLYPDSTTNYHTDQYPNEGDSNKRYASNHIHSFVVDNFGQTQEESLRRLDFLNCVDNDNGYLIPNAEKSRARGESMLPFIQGIADYSEYKGYPLQILCRQYLNAGDWEVRFETIEPSIAGNAVMSMSLGTIVSYTYKRIRPKATQILVGGSGEGVDRVFAYTKDDASRSMYGRIEAFEEYTGEKPDDGEETKNLIKYANQRLSEYGEQTSFQFQFQETEAVRYGRDFKLGDKVRVILKRQTTTNIVRAVSFSVSGNQEEIQIAVGKTNAVHTGLRLFDRLRNLEHRYDGLTKRTLGE